MSATELHDLLRRSWEGEVLGESYFSALADASPTDAELWTLLATLERVTAGLVEPVARKHGIEIDRAAPARAGAGFAASSVDRPRDEVLAGGRAVIDDYLVTYRRLAELLPADDAWLADDLVAHEQALAQLMDGTLAGRADADQPVREFIARRR